MAKPGPKTKLTKELFRKIKQSILDGNDLRKTAKVCDIEENTLYGWSSDNYLNISDKIEGWKRDRKVILATKNLEEMLQMDAENSRVNNDGEVDKFTDTGILRVKADMTKFTLETLNKENYSKRTEQTGAGGKDLIPANEVKNQVDNKIDEYLNAKENSTKRKPGGKESSI